jgi:hypothetical protein
LYFLHLRDIGFPNNSKCLCKARHVLAGRRSPSLLEVKAGRDHLLMQDADDQHSVRLGKVKHNVLANLNPAQAGMNRIAASTEGSISGQELEALLNLLFVVLGLGSSPALHRVAKDGFEVGYCEPCYAI